MGKKKNKNKPAEEGKAQPAEGEKSEASQPVE
jgi:hypothetical protein